MSWAISVALSWSPLVCLKIMLLLLTFHTLYVQSPVKLSVGPQSLVDFKQKYFDVALKFALNAYFNSAFVQPFLYAMKSEICEFLHLQILL